MTDADDLAALRERNAALEARIASETAAREAAEAREPKPPQSADGGAGRETGPPEESGGQRFNRMIREARFGTPPPASHLEYMESRRGQ